MITRRNPALVSVAACVVLTGAGAWRTPAQPPAGLADKASAGATAPLPTGKAGAEPVATIFGDVAVTREQFAEHLIRRYGPKELEGFVYRQIVSTVFARQGLKLSPEEIQEQLDRTAAALKMSREQLGADILKSQGKTIDEWHEDVNVPIIMLSRLAKAKAAPPTEAELRQAFDVRYGEKLDCRIIIWGDEKEARAAYEKVCSSEKEFDAHARRCTQAGQPRSGIATDGRGEPIPRAQPFEDHPAEQAAHAAAAKLRPGEVSPLISVEIEGERGFIALKCDRIIPADRTKSFEKEKAALADDVTGAKVNKEFRRLSKEIMKEAAPQYHLTFPKIDPAKR
ncbi:hypothetical protein R5W23_004610 [Gemmata sp. JC673]|uniref:peptidylprolyl isomerase n=1 Tax=Gemmata algarum TaxID=2975278 RepID=A0ABU5FBB5_9BACT|nr:hypothetical protein [Gemmata algarum]MDY3563111.1 hypothetical protein [Gemmata algarum]